MMDARLIEKLIELTRELGMGLESVGQVILGLEPDWPFFYL